LNISKVPAFGIGLFAALCCGQIRLGEAVVAPGPIFFTKSLFGTQVAPLLSLAVVAVAVLVKVFSRDGVAGPRISHVLVGIFAAALAATILWSAFPFDSCAAVFPWLIGLVAMSAIKSEEDVRAVMNGLFSAAVILALLGLHEYLRKVQSDPSWRIYSLYSNPNILASQLGLSGWIGCEIYGRAGPKIKPIVLLGLVFIFAAFLLTQSRGSFLMFSIAIAVFGTIGAANGRLPMKRCIIGAACALLVLGTLIFVGPKVSEKLGSSLILSRAAAASVEGSQSTRYRIELFRSELILMARHPQGYGIGTYRFEGGRAGLVQEAQQGHNTYLQIGTEAGVWAPLLLLSFLAAPIYFAMKHRGKNVEYLLAGVAFVGLHGLVESNLYFPGLWLSLCFVIGSIYVRLELVTRLDRRLCATATALVLAGLLYFGFGQYLEARVNGHLLVKQQGRAEEAVAQLVRWYSWSPATYSKLADTYPSNQLGAAIEAYNRGPSLDNAILLGNVYRSAKRFDLDRSTMEAALARNPNDVDVLLALMLNPTNTKEESIKWASRLADLQNETYLKIQPLPDLIFTEPAYAHYRLAQLGAGNPVDHFRTALGIYSAYCYRTVPQVYAAVKAHNFAGFAGQDGSKAVRNLAEGYGLVDKVRKSKWATELEPNAAQTEAKIRAAEAKLREVLQFGKLRR
jgi:O-antigen ligase